MGKLSIHPVIYRAQQEPRDKESFIWLHRDGAGKKVFEEYNGTSWEPVLQMPDPYISLERLRPYLYRVTFDSIPDEAVSDEFVASGCSSYVLGGKLYRNLDYYYDRSASFIVRTNEFEGMSFITGLEDGHLDLNKIAQLPYRVCDGINNHGIKVSTHVLINDWGWTGCGERTISLTKLPFLVLTNVKSMTTVAQDLSGVLNNLYASEGLKATGYLIQVLITDGTTTYALLPPTSEDHSYVLQNITAYPKLTNFRWVGGNTVVRTDLQLRPTGVERYNMMPCSLKDLRFTKAYEYPNRLSEFIGLRGTNKDSSDAELTEIYQIAHSIYLNRRRDGNTWQTVHSVVYGDKMESLFVQENWEDDIIMSSGVSKEYVDAQVSRFESALDSKVDAIEGKGLSENDFTDAYKSAVDSAVQPETLEAYRTASEQDEIDDGKVDKVTGKTLSSNDYTDEDKELVANAVQAVTGKGLSENDYTDEDKQKVGAAVLTTTQTLSNAQQVQARHNISAIEDAPNDGLAYVRKSGEWNSIIEPDVDKAYVDTAVATVEAEIPDVSSFATQDDLAAVESEIPDISQFATRDEIDDKVDKETGKGLSTNDYTTSEKTTVSNALLKVAQSLSASEKTQARSNIGALSDAPLDGTTYGRKDGDWVEIQGGGGGSVSWRNITGNPGDNQALAQILNSKAGSAEIETVVNMITSMFELITPTSGTTYIKAKYLLVGVDDMVAGGVSEIEPEENTEEPTEE